MDSETKKKLELLKEKAKIKEKNIALEKNVLLKECLEALGTYRICEDDNEIKKVESLVSKAKIYSHDDKISLDEDKEYYILWDEATLPVVISKGNNILSCYEDVMAVSFETYLVSLLTKEVTGIKH